MNSREVLLVVDNRVRLTPFDSLPSVLDALKEAFQYENPEWMKKKRMRLPVWNVPRVIISWRRESENEISFPRGGLGKVLAILEDGGMQVTVKDARQYGVEYDAPFHLRTLYPYQEDLVSKALEKEQCIVRAPTGSGKSTLLLALTTIVRVPTLIIVHAQALLDQWVERIEGELGLSRNQIGIVQGSKFDLQPITVTIQKTMAKHAVESEEIRNYFGCVLADECFEGSTPVLMEDGTHKNISDVVVGERLAVGGLVLRTMRKRSKVAVKLNGYFVTDEHPIAVKGVGWVNASTVCSDDVLCYDPMYELRSMRGGAEKALFNRSLPASQKENVCGGWYLFNVQPVCSEELVRVSRCFEVRNDSTLEQGADGGCVGIYETRGIDANRAEETFCIKSVCCVMGRSQTEGELETILVPWAGEEICQTRGTEEIQGKNPCVDSRGEDYSLWGAQTWEWSDTYPIGNRNGNSFNRTRIRETVCFAYDETVSLSDKLQNRFCASDKKSGSGNRWVESFEEPARSGRTQNIFPRVDWLEGASLPGSVRLRPGAARVSKCLPRVIDVYNLETQHGVYVAAGMLVHNCHLFAAGTFYDCVDPFPARYRIGASADHRRKDRKEFLIYDLFGEVAADISREEVIESKHVLDVQIRAVPTPFEAEWYGDGDGQEINFVKLVKEMAEDPERNRIAAEIVKAEVKAGEQVFVMCHEREHCMKFAQILIGLGIKTGYLLGGPESAKEFKATLEGLKNGKVQVGVGTYKAIGTGIDVPRIGVGVAMTPISGNEQFFGQVRGRVCRIAKGKKEARLYVIWDRNVYLRHLKNLVKWNDDVVVRDTEGDWIPGREVLKSM